MVARQAHNLEVESSSLSSATIAENRLNKGISRVQAVLLFYGKMAVFSCFLSCFVMSHSAEAFSEPSQIQIEGLFQLLNAVLIPLGVAVGVYVRGGADLSMSEPRRN